jgi:hypothetical protein
MLAVSLSSLAESKLVLAVAAPEELEVLQRAQGITLQVMAEMELPIQ